MRQQRERERQHLKAGVLTGLTKTLLFGTILDQNVGPLNTSNIRLIGLRI